MSTVDFEALFSDALIEVAARSLARQRLTRAVPSNLYVISAVSIVAFAVALVHSPANSRTWFIGVVAVARPVFFFLALNSQAREIAEVLRQRFQPTAQISLGAESFTITANGRTETMLWDDAREIVELKDYFLVVLPRIGGVVVPRANMPAEGADLVRGAARARGVLWMG